MSVEIIGNWFYAKTAEEFLEDAKQENYLGDLLTDKFKDKYKKDPDIPLKTSWYSSPQALADALRRGRAIKGRVVVLEYCMDTNTRIDALVCAMTSKKQPHVALVELKQWEKCRLRACERLEHIDVQFNEKWHQVLHPCSQVIKYRNRLDQILNVPKSRQNFSFSTYAYLHNCWELSQEWLQLLRGEKFEEIVKQTPLYTKRYSGAIGNRIRQSTTGWNGLDVLEMINKK